MGVYRFWRDSGYAVGALIAGALADTLGMASAIGVVAGLTFMSGALVAWRMPETLHRSIGMGERYDVLIDAGNPGA